MSRVCGAEFRGRFSLSQLCGAQFRGRFSMSRVCGAEFRGRFSLSQLCGAQFRGRFSMSQPCGAEFRGRFSNLHRRRARVLMVRHALHIRFVSFSVDVLFPSAARSGGLKRDGGQSPSAVAFRATLLGNSTRPGERGAPRTRSCDSRCPLDAQMTSCCLAVAPLRAQTPPCLRAVAPLRAQTPPCRHAVAPLRAWRIPCVRAVGAKDGGRLLPRLSRPPSFCRLPFIRNRYRGFNR